MQNQINIIIIGESNSVACLMACFQHQGAETLFVCTSEPPKAEPLTYRPNEIFELTAHPSLENCFFEEPTNKPKWFQGSESSKFRVPGKKQFNKYNSRKKSRNNKHK
jgi:hypothetical protein